jgi:beta-phosphoglucomutase-like phosphatase (HAD superfamily)
MPTVELLVSGILFDSDGTLIDSTPSISKVLVEWCQQQSIDPKVLAADGSIHGIRTKDILRKYQKVPKLGSEMTEEELESEAKKSEALVIEEAKAKREQGEKGGIEALPGVVSLVERFSSLGWKNWGIVTSGKFFEIGFGNEQC